MSSEKFQMLAKTFAGLEDVLKEELEGIGAQNVEPVIRGVKFTGDNAIMYKANFCCRTALRVLRIIGEFKIRNTNDLYQSVYSIDWSNYFDVSNTFAIYSTVNSEAFNNSMFVSLKTKDAIVDQFRTKSRRRPSVNTENPDIIIHVHASSDTLSVTLDSSGESLHKRGYRVGQNEASMNEVLAAGILKIAGWKADCDFYDTMCGSGTLPVEAALMARNIPPGIFRKEFAFEKWKDFDADLFEEVYNEDYEVPFEHTIYASDISSIDIKVSEKNAKSAGVLKEIQFETIDFSEFVPKSTKGLLIINPPYGERMRERRVEPLYAMIGDKLKKDFAGFKAWVFSSSDDGFKNVGLRPGNKIKLFNGGLECSLRLFEVYEGSKKASKQNSFTDNQRPQREHVSQDMKKRRRISQNPQHNDAKRPFGNKDRKPFEKRDKPRFDDSKRKYSDKTPDRFVKPQNHDEREERRARFHEMRRKNLIDDKKNRNDDSFSGQGENKNID